MKELHESFRDFVNESKEINEALSLEQIMKNDPDGKDGFLEIAKLLGAKPSDILVYDGDEDRDSKEYKMFDKEFTKGNSFKDANAPEYEDYYGANVAYSKKLNVVSTYAAGYLSFFAKK